MATVLFAPLMALVAPAPAFATDNPVVVENRLPGAPPSEWDVFGSGDASIRGYTRYFSYDLGKTVEFKVNTTAPTYYIDIYRLGYYDGMGARRAAPRITANGRKQPACVSDAATGLVDCGKWAISARWTIPTKATSGIYLAKLVRADTGGASHVVFIVRDDSRFSDILFQTADTTWQAYNDYGGNSLYVGQPVGRAYKVSYNRPMIWRAGRAFAGISNLFGAEYPMVRWLESNGYDVTYFSGSDTDRRGALIRNHTLFLSVGHDEYWSAEQRANVESARDAGVNLAFFSGNEVFWKTRWETSIDGRDVPYRTLVCYKETHANRKIDPLPTAWTGTWRDPRFSPPADGGRPENALTGQLFTVNGLQFNDLAVAPAFARMRLWRHTPLASMDDFDPPVVLGRSVLGFEWDEDIDNGVRPRGLVRYSSTTAPVAGRVIDYGSSFAPGQATHALTLYRAPSGALVFGAGTIQWSWGLDGGHDNNASAPDTGPDPRIQQATVNLFADMGVQPKTLQPGLIRAAPSTDLQAPTSLITLPVDGVAVERGQPVTIAGTAVDAGGGVVGGVEVSVDGGVTWHPATGREDWTYRWVPGTVGPATIRVAAVDDSANLEEAGATVTVEVVPGSQAEGVRLWSDAVVPAIESVNDPVPVEVGVKFASDVSGSINGIRFYKGARNTGAHFGHLWQGDGTLLASVEFETETERGWQFAPFPSPVPIRANTTYVASYHTDAGNYAFDGNYFAAAGVDSPPLHALRDGVDGGNGVYTYGGSGFPVFTHASANYWVDVDFTPSQDTPDHTTLWADTVVPAVVAANDSNALELGVKFRTDVDGRVTAIRFYKSSSNTGTHVGNLWTSTGALLATATFTGETASGWQQVALDPPVDIVAGSTYVASYHTETGFYSANLGYFAAAGVNSPPLYALRDGEDGPNGVYAYGPSGFPTATWQSTNYWVDVVFEPSAPSVGIAGGPTVGAAPIAGEDLDYSPRNKSRLTDAGVARKRQAGEAYNPLPPGARGLLNGVRPISPDGR
jgi:hypothetical protein